jgi:hypothetical protein
MGHSKYLYSFLLIAMALFGSCKKENISTYKGSTSVYFTNNYRNSVDSGTVTFSYSLADVKDLVVSIPVSVMGLSANTDRLVNVVVLDSSTARAGVHYDLLPETFKVRQGRMVDTLKIKVRRTPDLQSAPVSILLQLQANEHFTTDMQNLITNKLTGSSFSFINYRLMVNDVLSKPRFWLVSSMGNFSRKKVYLTAAVLGLQLQDMFDILLNNPNSLSGPSQSFWGRSMQIYLNQQKAAGTPVLDEDGTFMIMGSSVQ